MDNKKINYQKLLDDIILNIKENGLKPTLLVHSCCAPCSSYVLEYLNEFFDISVLYYNPNISPEEEYEKRKEEQKRLIKEKKWINPIKFIDCDHDNDLFEKMAENLKDEPEGGRRCEGCFSLRLDKAARVARDNAFDYFVTTLSISPLKNAALLNQIGNILSKKYGVKYLPSDFKKRNGYKRSIELSREYNLYRQNYCGCKYSLKNPV